MFICHPHKITAQAYMWQDKVFCVFRVLTTCLQNLWASVTQRQGKERRLSLLLIGSQYGEGVCLILWQDQTKNMGNEVCEVNLGKVSGQDSLGWGWQRLFKDSRRSMENKEELQGKQRTKGREGCRLRTQREVS